MIKKMLIWYLLLSKRLFKKPSFWAVLLLAPLLTAGMTIVAEQDAYILRIAVYAEPSEDSFGEEIAGDLAEVDGVISYHLCSSEEELRREVALSQADAGYVIPSGLTEYLREYAAGRRSGLPYNGHLIRVVTNDDNIQLQLAREQFYSVLYPHLSLMIAEQFTLEQSEFADMDESDVRRSVKELYEELHVDESIFQYAHSGEEAPDDLDNVNYLTSPLRGMLSLFVLLSGLSSTLYLLKDRKAGMFNWVRYGYRGVFEWICILSGTAAGGGAAYLALFFSGTFTAWKGELLLMIMLVFAVTGFCGILSRLIRNMAVFGTCIPLAILISAVLSPVFAAFHGMMPVKILLPSYFYLNSLYSVRFRWWFFLYLLAVNIIYAVLQCSFLRKQKSL